MTNVLPDLLVPNLDIVFCGTAAGTVSAQQKAYYAHPGNAFWRTLFEVGLTPVRIEPANYACITAFGLGFTDLAKNVFGMDRVLSRSHFDQDALRSKIQQYRPRIVAFTSKRAASEFLGRPVVPYGLLADKVGDTRLFVLPSPSGAARHCWSVQPWLDLAQLAKS